MDVATDPCFVDMDQDIALFFALLDFDPLRHRKLGDVAFKASVVG